MLEPSLLVPVIHPASRTAELTHQAGEAERTTHTVDSGQEDECGHFFDFVFDADIYGLLR
jgi:hypothetical protein